MPERDAVVTPSRMLTDYPRSAMGEAHYKLLGGGEGFYGEIPGFEGVLAQTDTLEACREELASTLIEHIRRRFRFVAPGSEKQYSYECEQRANDASRSGSLGWCDGFGNSDR